MAAMKGLPNPAFREAIAHLPASEKIIDMVPDPATGVLIPSRIRYQYDPESPCVVVFAMPTLVQCKKIFWKPILNLLTDHPAVERINKADHTVKFIQPADGSYYRPDIICLGLNDADGDRARGLRIAHINCDEIQDVGRGIFDEVIIPAMGDTPGSTALLTGTPKGKVNHLYDLYNRANEFDDWESFHFVTLDNDKLPESARREIERSRLVLSPRVFRQENEASFEDFPGQIFDHLDDHHLTEDIPDAFIRVILGVDWGDVNPALVVVGVTKEGEGYHYWVLDWWYSDTGQNILDDTLISEAAEFVNTWGIKHIYCGHDRPASIEKWGNYFWKAEVKQAFNSVSEGNNAVNGLFANVLLHLRSPRCREFKDELAGYHRRQDKEGNFHDEPEKGQVDHRTDALRYGVATDIYEPGSDPSWIGKMGL